MLSVELEFIWNDEVPSLKNFFDASKPFASQHISKIYLGHKLTECEFAVGLIRTSIKNERSFSILYKECLEQSAVADYPIWKHDTFIYTIEGYLQEIDNTAKIFSSPKNPSCRFVIQSESNQKILDESGCIIIGSYKSIGMHSFDTTGGINNAIQVALQKGLESFNKEIH